MVLYGVTGVDLPLSPQQCQNAAAAIAGGKCGGVVIFFSCCCANSLYLSSVIRVSTGFTLFP